MPAGPAATPISFDPAAGPAHGAAPAPLPDLPGGVPNVPAPATQLDQIATPPAATPDVVSTPLIPNKSDVDTAALDQARLAEYKVADAKAKEGALEGDQLRAESEAQSKLADVAHAQSIDAQAEIQAQKDGLAEARRVADQAAQEARDFKFHDYFEDKTTGQKIAAAIFVGLGGIGAGLQARVNPNAKNQALEAIDANVAQNFERQKAKLASKENFARYKERGVTDLTAQYRDDLAKLQLQQGLAYKAIADQAQAQLLAQKVPLAEAQTNTFVETIRAKGDEQYATGFQQLVRDKAMLALEKAKLGVAYGTLAETRRRDDLVDADKQAALDAKKEGASAKGEESYLRTDEGVPTGKVPSGRGGAVAFGDGNRALKQSVDRLEALAADIDKFGPRPTSPADIKRRNALYQNAGIAIGSQSALGKSDEALKSEKASIGAPGTPIGEGGSLEGAALGADVNAIRRKIEEYKVQLGSREKAVTPLTEDEKAAYLARHPEITPAAQAAGWKASAPASAAPPAPSTAKGPTPTDVAALKWAYANPKDPRAAAIKKANGIK